METTTIRISVESWEALKDLADRSGLELKAIVDEWASAIRDKLATVRSGRVSYMSACTKGAKDDKLYVVTYIAPLFFGAFRLKSESDSEIDRQIMTKIEKEREK